MQQKFELDVYFEPLKPPSPTNDLKLIEQESDPHKK